MKNVLLIFRAIVISSLLIVGCGLQTQPAITPNITIEPTETLTPTAAIKLTPTFLPTFTPLPLELLITPFPTQTLTPVPKDVFDNFQGLSGNCRTGDGIDSLMAVGYDLDGDVHITSMANVSISFDKNEYFLGNSVKLSVSANDSHNYPKLMNGIVVKVIAENPAKKRYSFYLYDDGTHRDEKADDGIYANTFDETLNTGMYKFYFQLSGRNKSTGEIFAKECFLAKTISPIPTLISAMSQGSGSNSCRKMEALDPVVVRSEGDGGNYGTEYGLWAHYPKAVSLGDRILTVWQVGSEEKKPNVYMRLLDKNVKPIGEVKSLLERDVVGFTTLISKGDNAVFSYCGAYDIGGYPESRSTSAFLDSFGNLISEQVRSPTDIVCGTGPLSVWTGSRILFYSWSNVFGVSGTFLDVADTDGNSISWRKVSDFGFSSVGFESVLTSSAKDWGKSLVIHRMDLEGNDLGEFATLEPLTYEVDGKIVVGNFRNAKIVPTADGWMIIGSLYAPGIYVAHLAPDGSLVSNPVIVEKELYFEDPNGFADVIPYKGGAAILGLSYPFGYSTKTGYVSLFISDNGTVQEWYPKENEMPIFGSFFEHQGRLFLIYQSDSTDKKPITNQVLIRELNCMQ